jgi:probable selenium-dependent hydroxylase accessory protein YqeC
MTSLHQALMLGEGGVISLVGAGGKTSLMFRLAHELSKTGGSVLTTTTTKILEPEPDQSSCVIVSDSVTRLIDRAKELIDKHHHITMASARSPETGKLIGILPAAIDTLWDSKLFRWIVVEADGAAGRPLKAPADHEPVIPDCTSCLVGLAGLNGIGRPLTDQWIFRSERFGELSGMVMNSSVTETAVAEVITHKKGLFKNASAKAAMIAFLNQADTPENFGAGQRIARLLTEKPGTGLDRVIIGRTQSDSPVLEIYELGSGALQTRSYLKNVFWPKLFVGALF